MTASKTPSPLEHHRIRKFCSSSFTHAIRRADYDGRTALHLAAFEGNSNFISWLIQSKANVNAVDRWGNTPLADAVKNLHELPAKILFESGSTLTHDYACSLLCDAALRGDAPFLQLLHECGTDVQDCDYDKRTALHLAAAEGQLVSVDFLIFAKSNIAFKDRWGKTAIDDAIRGGHYAVARLLQGVGGKPCGPLTPEQERLLADVDMTRTREETRCKVDAQQKSRRLKPHIRDLIKLLAREFGTADVQFARKIERLDKLATYAINKGGHEAMVAANTMSPEEAFAMPDLMLDDEEIARTNGAAEMDNRSDASDDCPNGAPYVPKGFAIRRFLGLEDLDRPDDSPPPFTSVCDEDEEQMRADGVSAQNNHRRVSVGGRSEISVEDEEAVRDRRMSTDALLTNPAVRDRKGSTGSCAQVPAASGRRVSTDILAMNREEDANLHPLVLLERNTIANSNRGTNGGKSVAKSNLETGSAAHRFTSFNQIILLFPTIEKGFELLRSRFENRGVKSFSKNDMYEFLKSDLEISEVTRKDLDEMFTLMDSNGGNSAEAEAEALDFLQLVISPSFAKLVERSADEAARVGRECIYAASIKESFSIINAAFELLDTTGKGQISIQELKNAIGGELKFGDQLVNLFARQLVIRRLDFMLSLLNWLGLVDEEEVDTLDDADTEANAIRRQSMYDGSGTGQKQQVTSESNADPASPKHGRSIFRTAMDESSRQEVASGVTKERQMADAGLALVAAYSSMRQPQGGKENTGAFDTLKDELTLAALSAYMLARHRQSTLVFFNEMWATMRFLLRPRRLREVEVFLVSMRLKDNATSIFNDMDRDFSGDIDVEEFASYIDQISTATIPRYRVYAAFNKFAEESVITLEAFKGMWGDCVRKLDGIIGNKSEQVLLCINASRLLIIPGSTYDHVFVFLQMCASVFLCASTPYAIAFYTEKHQLIRSGVLIPMYLADFIVWLGVFRRFITAYYNKDRKLVTNLSKIRKHYSKHDLAYDLIAAIPLDALLWLANNPPYRAIMWARISRAMRVRDVYRFMKSRRSELNEIRGQLENLLVTFLVTLHFLACIWQWLTSHEENYNYQSRYYNNLYPYSGYGSFATEEGDSGTLSVEKYFLSLYWVISALIGMGAGDLHPVTGEERWFTMALMILNLSVLAYVVGIVSSLFMSADERLVKLREEIAAANTFIESRDLPRELVEEINALSNLRASSRLASDTVGNDIFRHLSTSLQIEVASHISLNLIQNTRCFYNTGQNFLDKLSTMLVEVNVPPETVLIRRSDLAKTLYLVSSGRVDLVFEDVSGRADDDENAVVLPGASVSPIPFFFNVRHTCGARSYSQGQTRLFALDRDSYKRLIKLYPDEEETISHNVLDEDSGQAASGASSGGSVASGSSGTSSQEKGSGGSASGGSAAGSAAGSQCSGTSSGLAPGADQNDKDGAIENIHKAIQKARSKKEKERVAARCAAAAEGKLESLKQIVEQSRTTSVDEGDYDKRTPLHLAASEGHKEVVLWLIENGASVMVRDRFGNTPMNDALRHRHDQVVGILREAGGQLERTESDTAGALCAAAYKNDLTEIKRLVENHADPNAGDYDKRTALHIAASEGHIEIINYLLSRHADVNAYDRIGGTPLSDAIRHKRIEAQHVLRKAGATVQHDDDAAAELCRLASEGDLENMRVLVDNGLDVNLGDYDGRRALHLACCEEKLAVIEFLLACPGIDLNPVDRFGGTPLEDAIRENRHTVALLLEKLGAVRAHHPSLKPKYIHLTEISEERKKQRILQDIEKDAEHAAVAKLGESLRAIVGPFSACNKHIQEQMQALILNANPKTWRSRKAIQQSPNLTPADLISDVFLGNFRKFMKHEEHAEHMLDCYLACVEFHRDPTFDSLEELLTNYIGKGARREIITVSKFVIPVQEGLDAREGTNAPRNPSSQLLDPIISELEDRLENFLKKFYKSYHFKEVITSRLGRIWRITHICRRVYSSADEMTKCVIKDIKSIANDDALRHIYGERNERINRLNSAIDEHLSKLENIKKYSTELSIGHKVIYERGQRRRQILGDVVVADQ